MVRALNTAYKQYVLNKAVSRVPRYVDFFEIREILVFRDVLSIANSYRVWRPIPNHYRGYTNTEEKYS